MRRPRRRLRRRPSRRPRTTRRNGTPDRQRPRRAAARRRHPLPPAASSQPLRRRPRPKPADRRLALADADVQSWAEMLDADSRLDQTTDPRARLGSTDHASTPRSDSTARGSPSRYATRKGTSEAYSATTRSDDVTQRCEPSPGPDSGSSRTPPAEPSDHIILVEGPPDMIARAVGRSPGDRDPRNARLAPGVGATPDRQTRHDRDGLRRTRPTSRRGDRGEPRPDRRQR